MNIKLPVFTGIGFTYKRIWKGTTLYFFCWDVYRIYNYIIIFLHASIFLEKYTQTYHIIFTTNSDIIIQNVLYMIHVLHYKQLNIYIYIIAIYNTLFIIYICHISYKYIYIHITYHVYIYILFIHIHEKSIYVAWGTQVRRWHCGRSPEDEGWHGQGPVGADSVATSSPDEPVKKWWFDGG